MNKMKSYSSVWNVEKVVYGISDISLPFPVTYSQMLWFVVSLLIVVMFKDIPPLSFINGALIKYVVIPVGITWFMSQKTFDGKKPFHFIRTIICYALRPKLTYGGKAVKFSEEKLNEEITIVRSEKRCFPLNT